MTTAEQASGVQADGSWTPVFNGQREPFRSGHTLRLRHGAYLDRVMGPLVRERFGELLESHARCLDDPGTALALARAEVVAATLSAYLEEQGVLVDGKPRESVLKDWRAAERLALQCRQELGIAPLSAARLRRDEAVADANRVVSLEYLRERGAEATAAYLAGRETPQLQSGPAS